MRLELLPREVVLAGPRSRQLLLVTGIYADGTRRDLSARVRYVSLQPRVATVSPEGIVRPAADGAAVVKAAAGSLAVTALVRVAGAQAPAPVSFSREVVPLLTRAGCNALACHGSPVGKAGFKLSMFGADPAADAEALLRQERAASGGGKRANPADPAQSLFLQKATMQVPHQGGLRFKTGSEEYALLLEWLRGGAQSDALTAAPVAGVEVQPAEAVLSRAGERQRLLVTARYADGTRADVSHQTVMLTNDDGVAAVDGPLAEARGVGETAVFGRYLGRVGVAQVLVPQPGRVDAREYAAFRPAGAIDELALAKWKRMGFVPAALASDAEFLRRVSLDLTGTLPAPDEIRAFLADPAPEKRTHKIDELLGRPEFVDWWTLFWGDNLRNNGRLVRPQGAAAFRDWIRKSVAENKPYDRFVRELVTASGGTFTRPETNFYVVANTPPDRAEQVAQLFLGVRLQCAQCHNHPFEKWTRTAYHRFAAFFQRVQRRGGANNNEFLVELEPRGEYRHPETREVLQPAVLADAPAAVPADEADPRESLARWLTAPDNSLFARNLVNRVWAQFFGRGIVEPVDDVRATNPASNEALLETLARDFVARGWDFRHLVRSIVTSRVYQLSSRAGPRNRSDRQNFSRAYHRRLKAEALLDAVCQATGVPESFNGHPAGTRAIQLTDNRVASYFLDIFGRPRREVVCSCEREETANITQALHLINGATLQAKLAAERGRVAVFAKEGKADAEAVEELYLWTLTRPPDREERERAARQLAAAPNRRQALEDLAWVLLNSTEFLFNH